MSLPLLLEIIRLFRRIFRLSFYHPCQRRQMSSIKRCIERTVVRRWKGERKRVTMLSDGRPQATWCVLFKHNKHTHTQTAHRCKLKRVIWRNPVIFFFCVVQQMQCSQSQVSVVFNSIPCNSQESRFVFMSLLPTLICFV